MSSSFKPQLIIPEEVQKIIKAWCYKSHSTEWSGTLWYSVEGSFENKDLKITCKDIYVSDIGSAGYTEFDVKPDIVGYMCEKPELLDCFMGLVHSHNNMATFFSGTDTSTLREEGNDRSHFLSLIVNNAGVYTAKITRKVVEHLGGTLRGSYSTWGGETKELPTTEVNIDDEYLEAYEMNIVVLEDRTLQNSVDERYSAIMEEKRKRIPTVTPYVHNKAFPFQGYKKDKTEGKSKDKQDKVNPTSPNLFSKVEETSICKKEFLNETIYQLVTGSVASTGRGQGTPTAKDWVEKNMETIFDRRFSKDMNKFKVWMQPYVEFLIFENDATCFKGDIDDYTDDVVASLVAEELLSVLKTLKTNKYLESIIVELESYIYTPEDWEEKEEEVNIFKGYSPIDNQE